MYILYQSCSNKLSLVHGASSSCMLTLHPLLYTAFVGHATDSRQWIPLLPLNVNQGQTCEVKWVGQTYYQEGSIKVQKKYEKCGLL